MMCILLYRWPTVNTNIESIKCRFAATLCDTSVINLIHDLSDDVKGESDIRVRIP